MPYIARDVSAGSFHVYTHCVWAVPELFRDDVDRIEFLRHLARVTSDGKWKCIAYCLMRSHYHLIVEVGEGVLPGRMHALNLAYAVQFNRRHGLKGHVQYKRYGSRHLVDGLDILDTFSYVVRNPVEAGLCARPEDWPWSSYAGTVGLAEVASFLDPTPLLRHLERVTADPIPALRRRAERG
ncbi:MAG: transposase [Gaiellaceae bacterium]